MVCSASATSDEGQADEADVEGEDAEDDGGACRIEDDRGSARKMACELRRPCRISAMVDIALEYSGKLSPSYTPKQE